jgi:hypothetical protein
MRTASLALLAILCLPAHAEEAAPEAGVRCVIEEECLPLLRDVATREGGVLTLRLRDGGTRVMRDDAQACADLDAVLCVTHRLAGYFPASGVFVVEWQGTEMGGATLVDVLDGAETQLPAVPDFSPSGQRLVAVDRNETARDYDVVVHARREGRWSEETRLAGARDGSVAWTFLSWDGEDRIRLRHEATSASGQAGNATLAWDGRTWRRETPASRD